MEKTNTVASKDEAKKMRVELGRTKIAPEHLKWSKFAIVEGEEVVFYAQPFVVNKLSEEEKKAREEAHKKDVAKRAEERKKESAKKKAEKAKENAKRVAEGKRLRDKISDLKAKDKKECTIASRQAVLDAQAEYEEFKNPVSKD